MISIEKWAGLVTNASPYSIPPGAATTQVNLQAISPGQLSVRPGLQAVTLASTVSTTSPVVSAIGLKRSGDDDIVYQDADGQVYTASTPSGGIPPTFSAVPGAPSGLSATPGNGSAALTWTAPSLSGGADVTGYSVQLSTNGGTNWTFAASFDTTSGTVSGLTNGQAYVFRVAATNPYGIGNYSSASTSVTPAGPPSSPLSFVATPGNAQVVLTWLAPSSNGGSAVTDYVVQYSSNAGTTWTTFADGTSGTTGAVITGLTNGQPYVFRVAAVNLYGTSEYTAFMTPTAPLGVPDRITTLTATHGNQLVSLLWTAPAANHQLGILDYTIQQSVDGTNWVSLVDGPSTDTSLTVQSLTNGSSYYYRVAASNTVGLGPYSDAVGPIIPRTIPGSVTGLTATAGNAQIELAWTAPSSNGGATITDYRIQQSVNNGAYATITDGVGTTTSYTVTGLANGTQYRYRVAAINSEGAGADATSLAVTPVTVPLAPTNIIGTASGDAQITVRWTVPSDPGGAPITDYIIQYSSNSGSTWTTFSDTVSSSSQVNVTGLVAGTDYIFRVAAVNAVGTGNYSTASATVRAIGAPQPPTSVTVTGGNNSVLARWVAPTNDGGTPITGYAIQYMWTSNPTVWTTFGRVGNVLQYNVTSLQNGREYKVRIAAVNAFGIGAYAESSNSVTPGRVPDKVGAIVLSGQAYDANTNTATVTLSWTAPNAYGSDITGCVVQYSSSAGSGTFSGTSANTITLTGLSPFVIYSFFVQVVSTVGPSPPSNGVSLLETVTAPSSLTLSAVPSEGYVTIAYTVNENRGPILGAFLGTWPGTSASPRRYDITHDLGARTIVFATPTSGSTTLTVNVFNLAGRASQSVTFTAIGGSAPTSFPPTLLPPRFETGRVIQYTALPGTGFGVGDTVEFELSIDNGSTWISVDPVQAGALDTAPRCGGGYLAVANQSAFTAFGSEFERQFSQGLARHFISPPSYAMSFLLKARAAKTVGASVVRSPWSAASSYTVPAPSADAYYNTTLPLGGGGIVNNKLLLSFSAAARRLAYQTRMSNPNSYTRMTTITTWPQSDTAGWLGLRSATGFSTVGRRAGIIDTDFRYDQMRLTFEWLQSLTPPSTQNLVASTGIVDIFETVRLEMWCQFESSGAVLAVYWRYKDSSAFPRTPAAAYYKWSLPILSGIASGYGYFCVEGGFRNDSAGSNATRGFMAPNLSWNGKNVDALYRQTLSSDPGVQPTSGTRFADTVETARVTQAPDGRYDVGEVGSYNVDTTSAGTDIAPIRFPFWVPPV
jgi:titin